jgi:hypothetical protein
VALSGKLKMEPQESTVPDTSSSEDAEFIVYQKSPEFALRQRTMMFELSLRALKGNFDDLMQAIDRYRPKTEDDIKRWANDQSYRMNQQVEGTRTLHNFVASAFSVVDHTREIYGNMYEGKLTDFEKQRAAILDNHGPTQFVLGLRIYIQHCRLPQIVFTTTRRMAEPAITGGAFLSKIPLLKFKKFNSAAKKFIKSSPEMIDVEATCSSYHVQVEEFHKWFKSEQERIHHQEFAYIARMEEKFGMPM